MAADLDSELRCLQRTYRSSGFRLSRGQDGDGIRIYIDFECHSLEYRQHHPRANPLPLEIVIPDDYPNDFPSFNIHDQQPEQIRQIIVKGLRTFCEKKRGRASMIVAALKWLDDNLDGLTKLGCDVLRQQNQSKSEVSARAIGSNTWNPGQQTQLEKALKFVPKSKQLSVEQRWQAIAEHVDGKSAAQCIERFKEIREAIQAESQREAKVRQITDNLKEIAFEPELPQLLPTEVSKPTSQAVAVVLNSLNLHNIAFARVRTARFVFKCNPCGRHFDLNLAPTQPESVSCETCHQSCLVKFSFEILHVSNCRLGSVQALECTLVDYLPCDIWVSCTGCSSDMLIERVESGGKKIALHCHQCFLPMTFVCGDVDLTGAAFSNASQPSAKVKHETVPKKQVRAAESLTGIKKGTPLPDFGSCKHYAKSYRWLRFPCCGKAFPCDICHEMGTASNPHEMKWALKQICGYCSQESAIMGTGKCPCGRNTTRASSEFWNGGKGMRDQTRMNRHDQKKHAGAAKTKSQKRKRVGQKEA